MKKVKFITAIYSNLYGTDLGGRPSRNGHYRWSLLSLLRMTSADFTCYTSKEEYNQLCDFFYEKNNINKNQLELKVFDLNKNDTKDLINKWKDIESTRTGDRCIEIQYMKFFWFLREDFSYDYYFWIDAGLSHCGLLPNRFLSKTGYDNSQYYDSNIFDNDFLEKLIISTNDKIFIIGKENIRNYWDATVNRSHYKSYDSSIHIIGGLFGGKKELWSKMVFLFTKYLYEVTETDKRLYFEENILSLMYQNHKEDFTIYQFDTWWHEDNGFKELADNYFEINKSFYKILQEIMDIKK